MFVFVCASTLKSFTTCTHIHLPQSFHSHQIEQHAVGETKLGLESRGLALERQPSVPIMLCVHIGLTRIIFCKSLASGMSILHSSMTVPVVSLPLLPARPAIWIYSPEHMLHR